MCLECANFPNTKIANVFFFSSAENTNLVRCDRWQAPLGTKAATWQRRSNGEVFTCRVKSSPCGSLQPLCVWNNRIQHTNHSQKLSKFTRNLRDPISHSGSDNVNVYQLVNSLRKLKFSWFSSNNLFIRPTSEHSWVEY